jgi:hypothetical protein
MYRYNIKEIEVIVLLVNLFSSLQDEKKNNGNKFICMYSFNLKNDIKVIYDVVKLISLCKGFN